MTVIATALRHGTKRDSREVVKRDTDRLCIAGDPSLGNHGSHFEDYLAIYNPAEASESCGMPTALYLEGRPQPSPIRTRFPT